MIPQGVNKRIQGCTQACFINCRVWDDIITVCLVGWTLLLGFVLDLNLGGRQKIFVFFPLSLLGLLKSSWLILDGNLIWGFNNSSIQHMLIWDFQFSGCSAYWEYIDECCIQPVWVIFTVLCPRNPSHVAGTWDHSLQKMRQFQPRKVK